MPEYEARLVMGSGLPNQIVLIECEDDVAAVEAAELLVDGHDVELWRGPKKLGTLHNYMRDTPTVERPSRNVIPLRFLHKVKLRRNTEAKTPLADEELAALKQLSSSFSRGTIVPPTSSRLIELGYAREFMGNLMITDSGLGRLKNQ